MSSEPGKGATFTFYLPSAGEAALESESSAAQLTVENRKEGSVLVMDDEETIRVLAADLLEYLGYRAVTCSNGQEAIRLYREAGESGSPFYAVVMDLTIPAGMGGKEAAREILAYDPGARLIVSSGYSNDPVMAHHADYGFSAAVVKPYRCADLQLALKSGH